MSSYDALAPVGHTESLSDLLAQLRQVGRRLSDSTDTIQLAAAFLDQMPIPAWIKVLTPTGHLRMVRVNAAWQNQCGLHLGDYAGKTDEEAFGPDREAPEWERNDRRVLEQGVTLDTVEHSAFGDGREIHWHVRKWPIFDGKTIVAVAGIAERVGLA